MQRRTDIERPPVGPEAFSGTNDAYCQAAAAILLSLAVQLRGDDIKEVSRSAAVGVPVSPLPSATTDEFPIPPLRPMNWRVEGLASAERVRTFARRRRAVRSGSPFLLTEMAEQLYAEPNHDNAAALATMALDHDDLLVRVAAANVTLAVSSEIEPALRTLVQGVQSDEELTREVAATSLARYVPDHPVLHRLVDAPPADTLDLPPSNTSMLVHGTWAKGGTWWPPGGNFHSYIRGQVWADLYSAADRYDWSGGYSDGARLLASTRLVRWIRDHNHDGLSLMAHSHGGSVAMLASWNGIQIDRLVLLACPVHPAKYTANFNAINKVTSIRVKGDLVLLADGSGSRFTDPRYNEHVLPLWFNHSAPHDPAVWRRFNVPAML